MRLNESEVRAYAQAHNVDPDEARSYVAGAKLAQEAKKYQREHRCTWSDAWSAILTDEALGDLVVAYAKAV